VLFQGFCGGVNLPPPISLAAKNPYMPRMTQPLDDIIADFELLDDWEDRYRYIIDLGRHLAPLPDLARTEGNKVQGCVSQVWLQTSVGDGPDPQVNFLGDSDAHIVKGLVAIILALYSGKPASQITETDAEGLMKQLGLNEHLSPQRSNGLRAMVGRIRRDAGMALGADKMTALH
jgi:cysteine desulfuration protein SufE